MQFPRSSMFRVAAAIVLGTALLPAAQAQIPSATYTVSPPDTFGNVTVLISHENTAELSWRFNDGGNNNALLYEAPRPYPYPINLNLACQVPPQILHVYLRKSIYNTSPEDVSIDIPLTPPEPVVRIGTPQLTPPAVGNSTSVRIEYEGKYPGINRFRILLAQPGKALVPIRSWPNNFGDGPPASPMTESIPDLVGTLVVDGRVCSAKAATAIEADPYCDGDCDPANTVVNPISIATGNMTYADVDPLPGTSFFNLRRVYNSLAVPYEFIYLFGRQWRSPLDANLRATAIDDDEYVVATDEDGRQHTFVRAGTSYANIGRDPITTLQIAQNGDWILAGDKIERVYDSAGSIRAYRDPATGRAVNISYDSLGKPVRVEDSWGNWAWIISIDSGTGLIQSIHVEGTTSALSYTYSTDKQLKTVSTASGLFRTYEHQSLGLLSAIRDGAGHVLETHAYDGWKRSITSTGSAGDIDLIEYGLAGRDADERLTRVTWKGGRVELRYQRIVDGHWTTVDVVNGCSDCGLSMAMSYDEDGRVSREQARNGYISELSYDGDDRMVLRRTALAPSGCDPSTATDQCRLTSLALAGVGLVTTGASVTTRFEYGDAAWPEQATLVATSSVLDPGSERVEQLTFDPISGATLVRSVTGLAAVGVSQTRTATTALYDGIEGAAFNPGGTFDPAWLTLPQPRLIKSVDGARTDVSDAAAIVYYPIDASVPGILRARVAAQRNAAGHVTRFESYDAFGNVLRTVDANGMALETTFDSIGRLTSTTTKGVPGCDTIADPLCASDLTTSRTYIAAGPALHELSADGVTEYGYDSRGRLQTISRGLATTDLRERIEYGYDPATGSRNLERTLARESGSWIERRRESSSWNSLGQLTAQTHADSTSISYTYDAAGNLESVRDENHTAANTTYEYDPAGRLERVTQTLSSVPAGVVTSYDYDRHGNLTSVTDPNGNVTTYVCNDFGEMIRQQSPVTGITTYTYDASGNLLSTTDANAATVTRTYDALSRPTTMTATRSGATSENVAWTYDAGIFGVGRMTGMTDPAGATAYAYDRRGLLRSEGKTIEGATYTTSFQYDAAGNRTVMRYPSGNLVNYTYDYAGRPLTAAAGATTLVSSATYLPFGPMTQIVYGNGTTRNEAHDNRYRITTNALSSGAGTIASYGYGYDASGNITSITDNEDATFNRTFAYDELHRLITANSGASLWGAGSYAYDAMGNLLESTIGSQTRSFTYTGTTPKLSNVTEGGTARTVTYDAAGNEIVVGAEAFTYAPRNVLTAADAARYVYDGRSVRTITAATVPRSGSSLSLLAVDDATVNGEDPVTATVTLASPAPAGGAVIALTTSDHELASVPATVMIPGGSSSATFTITTYRPSSSATAQVAAHYEDVTRSVSLSVARDPRLITLTVPSTQTGAGTLSGSVTLDTPATPGGVAVTLSSSHPSVTVPTSVTVAEGAMTASFSISVAAPADDLSAVITAEHTNTRTATIAVYVPGVELAALAVKPVSVVGAVMTTTATLTLSGPARAGGAVVTLGSSDPGAAAVPVSVTVPEGALSATFSITTGATSSPTPVTITATYGATRTASITVSPCVSWVADASGFSSSETVWVDDSVPGQAFDTWVWDPNQKVTGAQSHTVAPGTGNRQWRFNMQNVYLTNQHLLTQYVLLDPCNPPRGLMLRWRENNYSTEWAHGAYWGEKPFDCGIEGPACRNMGPLPEVGRWTLLEVPAGLVGVTSGVSVWGVAGNVLDGRIWFDRTGFDVCVGEEASQPSLPASDVVWVDDAIPAGAAAEGTWTWDTQKKASGTQSHTQAPLGPSWYQHYFHGATTGLSVGAGDTLFAYVLLDPCNPAREVMIQFNDGTWEHRAYWGENLIAAGTDGTNSRRRIGDRPPAGEWVRLEVPAALLGLEGRTITGMAFTLMGGGQVWWDRAGKAAAQSGQSEALPSTMISASTGEETESAVQTDSKQPPPPSRWRRFLRRLLRRPNPPAPPVSMSVEAQFIGETNSTIDMKRYSLYSPELQLIAETSTTAVTPWIANEYVWFNGEPLAQINRASGEIAYYFNDHLGAPILQTDATGTVVWRVERDPYGERYATRVGAERHQPLGLPGQEYDASSDRQYNIFRWYRPSWGRYTQADPIGLEGGLNLYGYGLANPNSTIDPLGLSPRPLPPSRTRTRPCQGSELTDCKSKCGAAGILKCEVSQTFRVVRHTNGKTLWEWVDGPATCACNEPDWCDRVRDWVNDYKRWWNDAPPFPSPPPLPPIPPRLIPRPVLPGVPPAFVNPCFMGLPCGDPGGVA